MRNSFLLLLLLLCAFTSKADYDYHFFVQFKDKSHNYLQYYGPESFLTSKAIERRKRQNIPYDSFDIPVTKAYVDNMLDENIKLRFITRWLNGAVITVKDKNFAYRLKIKFFVDRVYYLGRTDEKSDRIHTNNDKSKTGKCPEKPGSIKEGYNESYDQIKMINGLPLHKQNLKGQGMTIAVFDAGFYRVDQLCAFQKLREEGRIAGTFDIYERDRNVYDDNDHGTNVLGVMAADWSNEMIGSAPEATYYLFRTELKFSELLLEELNWVRAAEMADSLGVDIINSSLGYNRFDEESTNHNHDELDGKTAFITKAASIAASRGMLVVNASGNDGNKFWKKINFPADAPGILTVGAVDEELNPPLFSSFGPTADNRVKPEIAALGYNTAITTTYGVGKANGTSFSCPLIAGMAACLWQSNRNLKPAEIIHILIKSSHLFDDPDNVIGYGVPDFFAALTMAGANTKFNYSGAGTIYQFPDTVDSRYAFQFYTPYDSTVLLNAEFSEPRKFLFFNYKKELTEIPVTTDSTGFSPIRINCRGMKKRTGVIILEIESEGMEKHSGEKTLYEKKFVVRR